MLDNSSDPEPEIAERERVTKERPAQRVRSWIVQNEMRSVPDWMTAGAA